MNATTALLENMVLNGEHARLVGQEHILVKVGGDVGLVGQEHTLVQMLGDARLAGQEHILVKVLGDARIAGQENILVEVLGDARLVMLMEHHWKEALPVRAMQVLVMYVTNGEAIHFHNQVACTSNIHVNVRHVDLENTKIHRDLGHVPSVKLVNTLTL